MYKRRRTEEGLNDFGQEDRRVIDTGASLDVEFRLKVLADLMTCEICEGFFCDPYTVKECLHTFCRSCIVEYIYQEGKKCPRCSQPFEGNYLQCVVSDRAILNLSQKLFPNFTKKEAAERKALEDFIGCPLDALNRTEETEGRSASVGSLIAAYKARVEQQAKETEEKEEARKALGANGENTEKEKDASQQHFGTSPSAAALGHQGGDGEGAASSSGAAQFPLSPGAQGAEGGQADGGGPAAVPPMRSFEVERSGAVGGVDGSGKPEEATKEYFNALTHEEHRRALKTDVTVHLMPVPSSSIPRLEMPFLRLNSMISVGDLAAYTRFKVEASGQLGDLGELADKEISIFFSDGERLPPSHSIQFICRSKRIATDFSKVLELYYHAHQGRAPPFVSLNPFQPLNRSAAPSPSASVDLRERPSGAPSMPASAASSVRGAPSRSDSKPRLVNAPAAAAALAATLSSRPPPASRQGLGTIEEESKEEVEAEAVSQSVGSPSPSSPQPQEVSADVEMMGDTQGEGVQVPEGTEVKRAAGIEVAGEESEKEEREIQGEDEDGDVAMVDVHREEEEEGQRERESVLEERGEDCEGDAAMIMEGGAQDGGGRERSDEPQGIPQIFVIAASPPKKGHSDDSLDENERGEKRKDEGEKKEGEEERREEEEEEDEKGLAAERSEVQFEREEGGVEEPQHAVADTEREVLYSSEGLSVDHIMDARNENHIRIHDEERERESHPTATAAEAAAFNPAAETSHERDDEGAAASSIERVEGPCEGQSTSASHHLLSHFENSTANGPPQYSSAYDSDQPKEGGLKEVERKEKGSEDVPFPSSEAPPPALPPPVSPPPPSQRTLPAPPMPLPPTCHSRRSPTRRFPSSSAGSEGSGG